jgi:transcription initiation factor TFIIA large subunit
MSNTQVGNVYQQIISEVVDTSRVDFEEGGVDESVLNELRQVWLTLLHPRPMATNSCIEFIFDIFIIEW